MDQPIEQPMFTPAREADSLTVLLPASKKCTALVPAAPTSVTVTEDVTVSTADLDKHIRATMGTCGQLVAERDRATAEIRRQAKDVLYPALIEMRKRYNNPGARTDLLPGITTFEAYLLSIGFCSSILRVWDHRQRQKELDGFLPSDGQKRIRSGSSSRPAGSSSPVVTDDDPDGVVTRDATSALVNLGYSRTDAKQAIEQALMADAKLTNDLDRLLCNALGSLSKVKPTSGNGEATAIIADDAQGVTTANPTESESAGVRLTDEAPLLVARLEAVSIVKLLESEIGSNNVRGAYAKLRDVFNRVADTGLIESALQHMLEESILPTLKEFTLPMLDQHPYLQVDIPYRPELQISVSFKRAGRARISAGDWVVYLGGDDRLTKQIGAQTALGRVVEEDAFSRPRVTWANGTKWLKPYSLFNQEAVQVLFADQAASFYPEAFSTYSSPTLFNLPAVVPTIEADASASSGASAVSALAAPAVAHDVEDARENPVLSDTVSHSPAESLPEDNLPAHSAGPVTQGFLPHGEAMRTQLVPGKKYQVRPAPSGGYGVYEPRSTVILQWHEQEDDARDAIDPVRAFAVGA